MKLARVTKTIPEPVHWKEILWGENYRIALENQLKPWLAKIYGYYLLKIGSLSAEINTECCTISHLVSVCIARQTVQFKDYPLYLPFSGKTIDACLLALMLPWCCDPHRLLCEVDRVLVDNGWLILSGFNPISIIGLCKLIPILRRKPPYNSRMFTISRLIDWLSLLNFEVLYYKSFQMLPWLRKEDKLLSAYLPTLGCMQLIIARKRTVPLTPNTIKHNIATMLLFPLIKATCSF